MPFNPSILTKMGGTLVKALFTKMMLAWALKAYAKSTDTQWDDLIVELFLAVTDNDIPKVQQAVKKLADKLLTYDQKKDLA